MRSRRKRPRGLRKVNLRTQELWRSVDRRGGAKKPFVGGPESGGVLSPRDGAVRQTSHRDCGMGRRMGVAERELANSVVGWRA